MVGAVEDQARVTSMSRSIKLPRPTIIRVYAFCREGERSVDAALHAPWQQLTEYYDVRKRTAIRQTLDQLRSLVPNAPSGPLSPGDVQLRHLDAPGPWRVLLRLAMAPWKKTWAFSDADIRFLASRLQALLDCLKNEERPEQQALVALRMDLFDCQWVIGRHYYGRAELAKAERIEHFNHSEYREFVKLEDLIRDLDPVTHHHLEAP